jgi:lysosomal acid lipase/cholesteryl ester hydrolase
MSVQHQSHLTAGIRPSGKLVDVDTAEASALPEGFSNGKQRLSTSSDGIISRPTSAQSMRIRIDKPSLDAIKSRNVYTKPINAFDEPLIPTSPTRGLAPIFTRRDGAPPYNRPTIISWARLQWSQFLANALSSAFLIGVVIWALTVRLLAAIPKMFVPKVISQKEWDEPKRWRKEELLKDVRYYAESCGFKIINETAETQDGYLLRVNRIVDPTREHEKHSDGRGGFPVLILHGLFQSSGSFVTSEERSLAFWLARQGGYQVFLGNNRGVFDMGHKTLSRSDPRFWDYNIRELAIYDVPALVDHVRKQTGYDKIAFIGHSQGNGTMFISLSQSMVPELGAKLSYFAALAPAVFAGPLTSCFPFTALRTMQWKTFKRFFGVLDFIPLMKIAYDYTPAYPFAALGYQMFAFLFAWTDANWLGRRKAKMFRFTPQPVSSASIYWWAGAGGFSTRGCTLDQTAPKWWDGKTFPPLSIFSGGMDFLVLTEPLLDRLENEESDVRLLRYKRQEEAEHCDHFWACDAVEWCFYDILEDIEATRTPYPEEITSKGTESSTETNDTETTRVNSDSPIVVTAPDAIVKSATKAEQTAAKEGKLIDDSI